MGDFIELGLEGADRLIDKHFHKIPDKFVDPHTYKPKFRRNSKDQGPGLKQQQQQQSRGRDHTHRPRQRSPSPPSPLSFPTPMADINNGRPRDNANSSPYLQDGPFISPPFSTMQPLHRSEYSPPPLSARDPDRRSTYDAYPARPMQMRRRSSSYHGPRLNEQFYSSDEEDERYGRRDQQLTHRNRNASQNNLSTRSKNNHNLKDEVKDQFTKSKEGLAGGALGALVGGWATHKALESRGKGKGDADAAWTLLGAAVGGLAVNAVVDKFEDRKAEERHARSEKGRDGRSDRSRGRRDWEDDEDRRYYR